MVEERGSRYIKWGSGSILLKSIASDLVLKTDNLYLELRQRVVVVEGSIGSYEIVSSGRSGKRKHVYIKLRDSVKPLGRKGVVVDREYIDNFEIRVLEKEFGKYITVVTPGAFLYDYIILSDDIIMVSLSGKREAYIDLEDNRLTIYVV